MANTVYTESIITLNASQAEATMNALKSSADELRKKMVEATKLGNSEDAASYQKQLDQVNKSMSSIRKETKDYSDLMKNLNGSTLAELEKAARGLRTQLKNLAPGTKEFIEKSSQLKQVKTRMDEVNGSIKKTHSSLDSLKGFLPKLGMAAIFAAAGKAVSDFAKEAVNQTQLIGDQWGQFVSGMSMAYGTFVAGLSSGQGWDQLISNMAESYRVGKEVAAVLDEIFERTNSLTMKEADLRIEINKQTQIMRDSSKSNQERLAAAEKIKELERSLADERRDIAEQELSAQAKILKDRTKMSDVEIDIYMRNYNQNKERIRQASEYNKQLRVLRAEASAAESAVASARNASERELALKMYNDAKKALDDYVNSASESLKQMAAIDEKYQLSNDNMVEGYVNAYNKLKQADSDYYAATTRANTTMAKLKKSMSDEALAAVEASYKDEVNASINHAKELENQAKEQYSQGAITEKQYQNLLTSIQKAATEERIQIAQKYKKDTIDMQSQLLDLTIKQREELMKSIDSSLSEKLKEVLGDMDRETSDLLSGADDVWKEEMDGLMDLLRKADEVKAALDPKEALNNQFITEMADLDRMHEEKLLSEEEYEQAKSDMVKRYAKENLQIELQRWSKGITAAQSYLNSIGDMVSALQEMELAQLDAQMEAELTAAGDNADEREKIEEKYEEKKLETQKKYAVADMVVNVSKALAAGALAIMQALAMNPLTAAVMIPIITATTAAQVATIIAQKQAILNASANSSTSSSGNRVATGFSEGGYTGRASNDYQEVGVVHANEWVAPASMVRSNPVLFRNLESMRVKRKSSSGVSGYADGGMAAAALPSMAATASIDAATLKAAMSVLQSLVDNGIHAYVVTSELNAKIDLENQMKKITGR